MERLKVLTDSIEQAHQERQLALDKVVIDPGLGLKKLIMQVIRRLNRIGAVYQRGELKLEVFLELIHLGGDLIKLCHTVLLKVVHGRLCVVDVDQVLLFTIFAQVWVQFVAFQASNAISVES